MYNIKHILCEFGTRIEGIMSYNGVTAYASEQDARKAAEALRKEDFFEAMGGMLVVCRAM